MILLDQIFYLSGIYFFCYKFFDFIGNKYYQKYCQIQPEHKKYYVIKNFLKSVALANICIKSYSTVRNALLYDVWDNYAIKLMGLEYAVNDIFGLLLVQKLPKTTKIHHCCVLFLLMANVVNDYSQENFLRLTFFNAAFSSISFSVNLFLAMRVIDPVSRTTKFLSFAGYYIYIVGCIFNWTVQFYYIGKYIYTGVFGWGCFGYLGILYMIIRDDIILMSWLLDYQRKNKIE